ncbi:MAG TPA: pyridoxal 5'-phosphate synthase glutaminase subunit PdxT [Nitriliruptorales bacterium]|nr:pyridoxal 5'-phosphate synthase glutaminase subunit PdxT [Nitriliruptorales bacterium]
MTSRASPEWVPGERLTRQRPPEPEPPEDAPTIGVLALQGNVLEHLRALREAGARAVRVRRPADVEGLDGLVIPGGESTTIGRLLDLAGLSEPLQGLVAAGLPAFGTCAGMILLSDSLDQERPQPLLGGLHVVTRRNAFGRQLESFETDLDVTGLDGGPLHAVFIRAPWVQRAGDDVEVLAEVDGHPVLVRQGYLLAAAFHPELTDDRRLHRAFVTLVRQARDARRVAADAAGERPG